MIGSKNAVCRIGLGLLVIPYLLVACLRDDREARRRAAGPSPSASALASVASASAGEALFERCAACHSIRLGAPDRNGPNLFGVMGRPIARGSVRFGYRRRGSRSSR